MNEYVREYVKIETQARRRGNFLLTYGPWVLLLAALAIFGRVWTQTQALRLVEELTRLKQEERELTLAREEHKRVLVQLTTRERISAVAREDLHMEYPAEGEVTFLPVAVAPEPREEAVPRRLRRPESGLAGFVQEHLRGVVNQEAYALSTM
jgi:cell division protein FtsL